MARAIVRWSVAGENESTTGNKISGLLKAAGFSSTGTALRETFDEDDTNQIIDGVRAALEKCKDPMPGGGSLDSIWTYIDQTEPPQADNASWDEIAHDTPE